MLILALLAAAPALAIYEEQAGLVDWHRESIGGPLTLCQFSKHQAFLATEASVLASVDVRSGALDWRQALPENEGPVSDMRVVPGVGVFTLQGRSGAVRLWNAASGALKWDARVGGEEAATDTAVMAIGRERLGFVVLAGNAVEALVGLSGKALWRWSPEQAGVALSALDPDAEAGTVRAVGVDAAGLLYMAELDAKTGDLVGSEGAAQGAAAPGAGSEVVVLPGGVVAYLGAADESGKDAALHLRRLRSGEQTSTSLAAVLGGNAPVWRGAALSASSARGLPALHIAVGEDWHDVLEVSPALVAQRAQGGASRGTVAVAAALPAIHSQRTTPRVLTVTQRGAAGLAVSLLAAGEAGEEVTIAADDLGLASRGRVTSAFAQLADRRGEGVTGGFVVRVMLGFEDHSISAAQVVVAAGGEGDAPAPKVLWSRQESLASVVRLVSVELPPEVLEGDAELAEAIASGNPLRSALARWQHQAGVLAASTLGLVPRLGDFARFAVEAGASGLLGLAQGGVSAHSEAEAFAFGFKRALIVLTAPGKVLALNSETGDVIWSVYCGGAAGWSSGASLRLYVTREDSASSPEVLVLDPADGRALWLNALTGAVRAEQLGAAPAPLVQAMLVSASGLDDAALERDVLLAVDAEGSAHLFPDTPAARAALASGDALSTRVLFSYEPGSEAARGVGFTAVGGGIATDERWRVAFPANHRIVGVAAVNAASKVDSPARALGDNSVLIKHLNPHVVAIASIESAGSGLTIMLVDVVSGAVVHRLRHKRATEPVHIVRFEHWVVYSYWNEKVKRSELGVITMYDGAIDSRGLNPWTTRDENSTGMGTTFSSFTPGPEPIVLHRTFSLPSSVRALGVTDTLRGVSSKKLLLGNAAGQVVMLDTRFLDPRRPDTAPSDNQKKEGLMQYHPELPIIPTQVVTYNRSVERLRAIYPIPARLESTSLVLSVGLDLFYTRTTPSQPFDLLAEDFNYALLVILTVALTCGTLAMKVALQRKNLAKAWR